VIQQVLNKGLSLHAIPQLTLPQVLLALLAAELLAPAQLTA